MSKKVIKILNKYTFNADNHKKRLGGEARAVRNRTLFFAGILLALCLILISMGLYQKYQNGMLADEISKTEKVLEERNTTYENLKQEIAQLNDDDYIRRIARSEFFMSEEGEIVFSLPQTEKNYTEKKTER